MHACTKTTCNPEQKLIINSKTITKSTLNDTRNTTMHKFVNNEVIVKDTLNNTKNTTMYKFINNEAIVKVHCKLSIQWTYKYKQYSAHINTNNTVN